MLRVVVLGTGTGVGKTRVTQALAASLKARGCVVQALKPVETGVIAELEPPAGSDARALEEASSFHVQSPRPHPRYALGDPISPHLAARNSGVVLELGEIAAWIGAGAKAIHDMSSSALCVQLLETAGGAWSPITESLTNVDLAAALDPAIWILVAPDALGVLHDVRATLMALSTRGRQPDHVVLSAARSPDASTGTNAAELARLGLGAPTDVLARNGSELSALAAALIDAAPERASPRRS